MKTTRIMGKQHPTWIHWKPDQLFSIGVAILAITFLPITIFVISQRHTFDQYASMYVAPTHVLSYTEQNKNNEVHGIIFVDRNDDGTYDSSVDSVLQNAVVNIKGAEETVQVMTSAYGEFEVKGLVHDEYSVDVEIPTGFEFQSPRTQSISFQDSNLENNTYFIEFVLRKTNN